MENYQMFKKYSDIIHPNEEINNYAIYGAEQPIHIKDVQPTEDVFNQLKTYNEMGYDIYTLVQKGVGFKDVDVRETRWRIADWDCGRKDSGEVDDTYGSVRFSCNIHRNGRTGCHNYSRKFRNLVRSNKIFN